MKAKVLEILRSTEGYVSGQSICEKLGVSRTAVWKIINQLKEEGYKIEAVNNKGYRIVSCPDVLTKSELESVIAQSQAKELAGKLYCHEITDSTNTCAKKLAEDGAPHGTLVVAEQQTCGRGRRGRSWISPKGTGIWMTYVLRPSISPDRASMLTLVAAMAVAAGIRDMLEACGRSAVCKIKWPNDIVINGRKIVGILTEMSAEPELVNYVAVGIGINVNTTDFDENTLQYASSILLETGVRIDRSRLIARITVWLEKYYAIFCDTSDMSRLMAEYNSMLVNNEQQVMISEKQGSWTGTSLGIDVMGELLVRRDVTDGSRDEGIIEKVLAGEVSVRGMYGYV